MRPIAAPLGDALHHLPVSGRKEFGGMGRSQLAEMKTLQKENTRLKKIVADLELDKLVPKESLEFLRPKA